MKKKWTKKGKVILSILITILLILGGTAYWAADRFLIPHVEGYMVIAKEDTTPTDTNTAYPAPPSFTTTDSTAPYTTSFFTNTDTTTTNTDAANTPFLNTSTPKNTSNIFTNAPFTTLPSATIPPVTAQPTTTLTSDFYSNGKVSIKITTVSKVNLTYYVADVQVSSGKDIMAAFAKNLYGKNIIQVVSQMAPAHNAIFAINGDYYGFRSDGIVIRNGVSYRDKGVRDGLAIYKDGTMKTYDEKTTTAQQLLDEGVWNALSFGPALLSGGNIVPGIETYKVDSYEIQGLQPRTGIGIISQNHFIFVVADGRQSPYSVGVTMTGFAQIFQELGCTTAYNSDGGGSAEMWFNGLIVNRPSTGAERGTSDIIYIAK